MIGNTRSRNYHALNDNLKSSSTKDILGIDVDTYRRWIEGQFTPEMNWSNFGIDHVKPICLFDISNNSEIREEFYWN